MDSRGIRASLEVWCHPNGPSLGYFATQEDRYRTRTSVYSTSMVADRLVPPAEVSGQDGGQLATRKLPRVRLCQRQNSRRLLAWNIPRWKGCLRGGRVVRGPRKGTVVLRPTETLAGSSPACIMMARRRHGSGAACAIPEAGALSSETPCEERPERDAVAPGGVVEPGSGLRPNPTQNLKPAGLTRRQGGCDVSARYGDWLHLDR